jgi:hypothetical protein
MPTTMSEKAGLFSLQTPRDLREKLRHDLRRIESAPTDAYAAFDFFVTAEHMLDWVYPGAAKKPQLASTRNSSILLKICSHVANGAKHFQVEDSRHNSVTGATAKGGYFGSSYFGPRYFGRRYFSSPHLVIELTGKAKTRYGSHVPVLLLAKELVQYWSEHPDVD